MKKIKIIYFPIIFCFAVFVLQSFIINEDKKLRTDGYYCTYDTIVNSRTNEQRIRFYPMVLFEDKTLSDFYYQNSKEEFDEILARKKYKYFKKYSKFGDYKINGDSIYIHLTTWSNKLPGASNRGKEVDAFMSGIALSDTTFRIDENIFNGDTIKQNTVFKFVEHQIGK